MPNNIVALSDLHIGSPLSILNVHDIEDKLVAMLKSLGNITEIFLLGDILDLTMSPRQDAWSKASFFFRKVFEQVCLNSQIYYIPGNHDHHVWNLLIEYRDIILPLQTILCSTTHSDYSIKLPPLSLVSDPFSDEGVFTPDDNTFVHALFPRTARDRLFITYPFKSIPFNEKSILFQHGHYFDWKITPLLQRALREGKLKDGLWKAEEFDYAYLEAIFYFAAINRSGREFLGDLYDNFKPIGNIIDFFASRQDIGKLPIKKILDLMRELFEKNSYTLVFGHTHATDSFATAMSTIEMYNTGGWQLECDAFRNVSVKPSIFQAINDSFNLVEFAIDKEDIAKAAEMAKNVNAI